MRKHQVGGMGRGEPQAVRQKAVGRRSHAQTLTCTLGVGGSPRQDDLWEGRKESGPHPQPPISPTPPTAPPHFMILPVLHGGPGSGEQRGAVRAWERCRCGSCRHRPAVNSGPGPPPCLPGPASSSPSPEPAAHLGGWIEGPQPEAQWGMAPRTGPS